jgi:hypothetical protein
MNNMTVKYKVTKITHYDGSVKYRGWVMVSRNGMCEEAFAEEPYYSYEVAVEAAAGTARSIAKLLTMAQNRQVTADREADDTLDLRATVRETMAVTAE